MLLLLRSPFLFVVGIARLVESIQTFLAFAWWLLAAVVLGRLIDTLVPGFGCTASQQQEGQRNGDKAEA